MSRRNGRGIRGWRWRHWLRRAGIVGLWAFAVFVGVSIVSVALFRFVNPPAVPLMVYRWIETGNWPRRGRWRPLPRISPNLMRAVIASEDSGFCRHHGIDWDQIRQALREYRRGEPLRGASTITNQTARTVFLLPEGGFLRKGMEWWFSILIETLWPKRRIMEVYLNTVEWGPGVFGAPAAARHWFGRSVGSLTSGQAALLATTLPNPRYRRANRPSADHRRLAVQVQARMGQVPVARASPCPPAPSRG